jgi:TatD DNase family protein
MDTLLFDTHCHIDEDRFDEDRYQVLQRMRENGVGSCVCVGSDMETSRRSMTFAEKTPDVYAAVGIHPHEAKYYKPENIETLKGWLLNPKVKALGEIGLDYYYDHSPRDVQRDVCAAQITLGYEENMPVIFHVRDAHGDMLDIMHAQRGKLPRGILHCYSGSWECAKEYLKMGFYLSIAGPVTFKKAPIQWEVAQNVPLDRLLIETDSPYLAPEPMRGRRNEPAFVRYVAEKIAALRNIGLEELAAATTQNAKDIYRIA